MTDMGEEAGILDALASLGRRGGSRGTRRGRPPPHSVRDVYRSHSAMTIAKTDAKMTEKAVRLRIGPRLEFQVLDERFLKGGQRQPLYIFASPLGGTDQCSPTSDSP